MNKGLFDESPEGFQKTKFGPKTRYIPNDWKIGRLGDNTYLKGRIGWHGLSEDDHMEDGEYYLVTGTDFENGRVQWDRCKYVNKDWYEKDTNIQLEGGDILVTKDGSIGKVAYVNSLPGDATLNNGVFVLRPLDEEYNPLFLYYILNSFYFEDFIETITAGSTISHLYQKDFVNFRYPIPSLPEQNRIADILSIIDDQVQQTDKIIQKIRELKRGVIQDIFLEGIQGEKRVPRDVGPITHKLPESWDVVPAQEVCNEITVGIVSGATDHYVDTGIPFVRSKNIELNRMNDSDLKYIDEEFHQENLNSELVSGDVLTQRTGRNGGMTAVVPDRYDGANCFSMLISRTNNEIDEHYYAYYLNSPYSEQFIESRKGGGVQKNLNAKFLRQLPVFLPSIEEQRSMVDILSTIDQRIEQETSYKDLMNSLKRGIMQDLLTGKVRVNTD